MATEQEMKDVIQKMGEIPEKFSALENRVQLQEIRTKQTIPGLQSEPQRKTKKIIQINANGRKYFCMTEEEVQIFLDNNPHLKRDIQGEIDEVKATEAYRNTKNPKHNTMIQKVAQLTRTKMETFHVELPESVIDRYLNDPENKKQFIEGVKV